jgi:TetR/AcrR family macrolide resistance operon transcriptional repressor
MARPLSVTDDQILDATHAVLIEMGAHGLTVSEIARRVGVSRAAISQRFGPLDDIKRLLMDRMAAQYEARLAQIAPKPGAAGLIAITELIGGMIKERERFSNFMFRYNVNIHDPILLSLEERRGQALRQLIARVMPDTALPKPAAVDAFMAHMTGSMINWQASQHPNATAFLRERTANWIRLAGIPFDEAEQ